MRFRPTHITRVFGARGWHAVFEAWDPPKPPRVFIAERDANCFRSLALLCQLNGVWAGDGPTQVRHVERSVENYLQWHAKAWKAER